MTTSAHILVVDDEEEVRDMIAEYLSGHGFTVSACGSAADAKKTLECEPTDLVLLDITMPGEDGLSLARHIRATHTAGIIMVTASGSVVDRIVGLEIGADDYVAKPFDPRELLARVRSVLRRAVAEPRPAGGATAPPAPDRCVRIGRCLLDLDGRRLTEQDGTEIPVTAMEFDLLKAFAERPNRVLTRDQLLDLAHHRDLEPFDRSIDIRIARLRRKVEAEPSKPESIKTIRGVGYMFVPRL